MDTKIDSKKGRYMLKKWSAGFTLIELMVVIAIIAILTGLVGSNYLTSRARARDAERKNDLRQIQSALEMYHNDHSHYPAAGFGTIQSLDWGEDAFVDEENNDTIYMPVLPGDPAGGTQYYYEANTANTKYRLCAFIENEEDGDIQQIYPPPKDCGGPCNYCVNSSNTTNEEVWDD